MVRGDRPAHRGHDRTLDVRRIRPRRHEHRNMSILGLTIDYGPYGWLEPYDPGWTPNTTDFGYRRYAYGQQPAVALWNLSMLARALYSLVPDEPGLVRGLEAYRSTYERSRRGMWLRKLGLA